MKTLLQVLGAFIAFALVLEGSVWMLSGLEAYWHPLASVASAVVLSLELKEAMIFHVGVCIASAGLTFFWVQRRR